MWGFFPLITHLYRAAEHIFCVNIGLLYQFFFLEESVNHPTESICRIYMNNRCCSLMNLETLCVQQLQTWTFDHSEILHLKTQKHLAFKFSILKDMSSDMPDIVFE